MKNYRIVAASMLAAFGMPSAANAVVTAFASFSPLSGSDTIRFINNGNNSARSSDATFYSTSTSTSTAAGYAITKFSFLATPLAPYVSNVTALFLLQGIVAKNTPANVFAGNILVQGGVSGAFSFLSTTAITVTGPDLIPHTYAQGSNLLSGTFTNATLSGGQLSSHGSLDDATGVGGSTIVFTSDFLDLTPTTLREFDFSLSSIVPTLRKATGVNGALQSFRGVLGGEASADPAPLANGLADPAPEPAIWAMMVLGFGAVGTNMRRRDRAGKRVTACGLS